MMLPPGMRKLVLAVHITVSVGWIGAVAGYIALDVTAASSHDPQTLRAAYVGMYVIARDVIVWLALAALLTGVLVSVGTRWGLLRHYWVVISLTLTAVAFAVLVVELQTIRSFAAAATDPTTNDDQLRALGNTLVHSIGGAVVLSAVLVLNVYKPAGLTRYGWRKQRSPRPSVRTGSGGPPP